jgi:hypothetical protein
MFLALTTLTSVMATSSRTLRLAKPAPKSAVSRPAGFGSWMGILAATSLGVPAASTVRAEVRADAGLSEGRPYRLVVQSYDSTGSGTTGSSRARPVGSIQMAVTPEELRRGVHVDLMELRQAAAKVDDDAARGDLAKALVLAWVEEGRPDLELDARRARPLPGSFVGEARRGESQDSVRISVKAPVASMKPPVAA